MKIAILTFTENTNIGQRLQNYALQHVLESKGHHVETIKQEYPFNKFKRAIRNTINIMKEPIRSINKYFRKNKFDDFNRKNIHFFRSKIPFYQEDNWLANEFDAFVVGSDQVWSPVSPDVGPNYFLTFARKNQRMTYAPSLSVDSISDEKAKEYKNYLMGFSNISVREDKGADIIEGIIGKRPTVVLDPTLLLEKKEWDEIKEPYKKIPKNSYILAMFLGSSQSFKLSKFAKDNNLDIFEINKDTVISPSEFISLVESARLVLTDSYHVTIFSIIYEIPFISFPRIGASEMNSRFKTLYRLLEIQNRNWDYLQKHYSEIMTFDFENVRKCRKEAQLLSFNFLESQLNSVR